MKNKYKSFFKYFLICCGSLIVLVAVSFGLIIWKMSSAAPIVVNGEYQIFRSQTGYNKMLKFYQEVLSQWPVPFKEIDVDTSFGKTHIIISGLKNKKPMVLIDGGGGNSTAWIYNIKNFSKNYRVYAIDTIGNPGKSRPVILPKTAKEYADWLNEVFIALDIPKASIIGPSYGGFIFMWFLHYYPEKVDKGVILSYSYMNQSMKLSAVSHFFYHYLFSDREGLRSLITWLIGHPMEDKQLEDQILEQMDFSNKYVAPYRISMDSVPEDSVKKITTPVMIIMGEKDVVWDVKKTSDYIKKLNNTFIHYKLIPGMGHMWELSRADFIDSAILDFLK